MFWRLSWAHVVLLLHRAVLLLSLSDGDLRLNGFGSSSLVGRLEVFYQGHWGAVCGGESLPTTEFNIHAAHVACRQMGLGFAVDYYSLLHLPEHRYQYGVGTGPIFLSYANCRNLDDVHLLQCTYGSIGPASAASCNHTMDVVLQCSNTTSPYNGQIRLTPDPATPIPERASSSGFVELFSNGTWRGVCHNDVDTPTGNALCRQLGYTEVKNDDMVRDHLTTDNWLLPSPLSCGGNDGCISSCLTDLPEVTMETPCQPIYLSCMFNYSNSHLISFGNQEQCQEAPFENHVVLSPPPPTGGGYSVRRVDVFKGGEWGTLCYDGLTPREADVICKQLGYPSVSQIHKTSDEMFPDHDVSSGTGPVYHLRCIGVENSLSECTWSRATSQYCTSHANDLALACSDASPSYGSLSLRGRVGTVGGASGALVLYNGSIFHPVCDQGFTHEHAMVACQQLGYEWGAPTNIDNSYFGFQSTSNTLPNLLRLIGTCSGSESQILSCPLSATTRTQWSEEEQAQGFSYVEMGTNEGCRQGLDEVSVQCGNDLHLRLVGGAGPNAGRLEVNYETWGRICGEGFGLSEAHVVCSILGYQSVTSLYIDQRYGVGEGPIHFSNMTCSGFESSLIHCDFNIEAVTSQSVTRCPTPGNVDIAIECGLEPLPSEGQIRLVDGDSNSSNQSSGRLEVSLGGLWHSVCGKFFSEEAALVSCGQLGYTTVEGYCTNSCYGEGSGKVLFVEDHCTGDEDTFLACPLERRHPGGCNHDYDVGLICEGLVTAAPTTKVPIGKTGLPLLAYYIIAAGLGLFLITIVIAMVVCCTLRRRKRKREGTWSSTRGQNGHHHHNGGVVVVDVSQLAKEKEGGFDDPKEALEMHPPSSPSSSLHPHHGYETSQVTPQHDVIIHALSHGDLESYTTAPSETKVKGGRHRTPLHGNGYHQANPHHLTNGNGHGVAAIAIVETSVVDNGTPICPPPDYRELFHSSISEATPTGHHVTNGHSTWYEGSDSEEEKKREI